jgi:divalent metal cation (Fe/Co/Zn/Cd) transporter
MSPPHPTALTEAERARLQRLGLRLEWATIGWNLAEAGITVGLGIAAGSLALIGFGADSLIEVFASAVVVWHVRDLDHLDLHGRSTRAIRLIALAFAVLGTVLIAGATQRLLTETRPDESPWGIAYLALAAAVMFGLAFAKRRVAARLDNAPLRAEAGITLLDGFLASGILFALVLTAAFEWWWADPLAAAAVGLVALNEAREHWQESRETGDDDD